MQIIRPPPPESARRFSNRTLLLMVVALLAYARFWCATRSPSSDPDPKAEPTVIDVIPINGDR